ncbi:alpha/beta-hydrolase [Auricularia subglabra TFB-10046 SS5]|nr:alpha/beta-hydrolase [Auricularia subglabra TFB-10046 SS5]
MNKLLGLFSAAIALQALCASATVPSSLKRRWLASPRAAIGVQSLQAANSSPGPLTGHSSTAFALPTRPALRVDGGEIPLLSAKVQDSYAGRVPISSDGSDNRTLFFWYWPSSAKHGSDTFTIWLNGGPGCSSLTGFLTENGAFTFRPGTPAPSVNPYAWSTVSDMLYVDQPVSTGFSSGQSNVTNEYEVADQFYGFLKNFYSVFPELLHKQLFVAGESYAGMYIPYIADRIVHASRMEKAALPIDLQSILINDGLFARFDFAQSGPVPDFVATRQATLGLNDTFVRSLEATATQCGWQNLMDQIAYPPKGPIDFDDADLPDECFELWDQTVTAATDANPCFNVYRITDRCPTPNDPIEAYFSREDVQKILHVPHFGPWVTCGGEVFPDNQDLSSPGDSLSPELTKALPRGMTLWNGLDDFLLLANGTRLVIQDLTWGGIQGFQRPITQEIVLDGHYYGVQHSERGLTYYEIANAGHMIPADQPKLSLEVFKTLLGKGSLVHTDGSH